MKFNAREGDTGLVYDADGLLVPGAIEGDTETGVVVCVVRDSLGNPLRDSNDEAITTERRYRAPLRVEPLPQRYDLQEWVDSQPMARPLPSWECE